MKDPNSEEGSSSSPKVRRKKKNPGKMKKVNLEKASSFFHYLAGISIVLLVLFYFATKYSYNQFVAISVGICLILFLIVCVVSAILDCILCSRYYRHLKEWELKYLFSNHKCSTLSFQSCNLFRKRKSFNKMINLVSLSKEGILIIVSLPLACV